MSNIAIKEGLRVYLIGIGGISMSGIAQMLLEDKCIVSGSDRAASPLTDKLCEMGIKVYIGHNADNIHDCDLVVYSAAINAYFHGKREESDRHCRRSAGHYSRERARRRKAVFHCRGM